MPSNTLTKMEKFVRILFLISISIYLILWIKFKGPANWKKGGATMKPDMKSDATKDYWKNVHGKNW